ncbi:hypothetical protein AWV80_25985 [Cupriavidus sp. UYMU48A]|nr:hypothetical protein AWV80_25985 [Cupriavidus sp. UYMU48A]
MEVAPWTCQPVPASGAVLARTRWAMTLPPVLGNAQVAIDEEVVQAAVGEGGVDWLLDVGELVS